jgi:hypothetical protein
MLSIAGVGPKDYVVDLGSGDGRIVIAAAKQYQARALGIDYDQALIAESRASALTVKRSMEASATFFAPRDSSSRVRGASRPSSRSRCSAHPQASCLLSIAPHLVQTRLAERHRSLRRIDPPRARRLQGRDCSQLQGRAATPRRGDVVAGADGFQIGPRGDRSSAVDITPCLTRVLQCGGHSIMWYCVCIDPSGLDSFRGP